jgi:hypothetical protein
MTTLDQVFETLRTLAENDTANAGTENRRPSWAPALTVAGELDALLTTLGYWKTDDKRVLRLWASFADPKQLGMMLRVKMSESPMPEARCRAFELRTGTKRSGPYVLRAKRDRGGRWGVDNGQHKQFRDGYSLHRIDYELRTERRHLEWCEVNTIADPGYETTLQERRCKIAALEEEHQALTAARNVHREQCDRLHELAKQRVAEFAGDPFAQMIAGAYVSGNCAICGRHLTDPISLERRIGPERYGHIAPALRAYR